MSKSAKMKLRTFSVRPSAFGFRTGLMAGLSASDYAFDPGLAKVTVRPVNPVTLDVEALRGDVERAGRSAATGVARSKLAPTG